MKLISSEKHWNNIRKISVCSGTVLMVLSMTACLAESSPETVSQPSGENVSVVSENDNKQASRQSGAASKQEENSKTESSENSIQEAADEMKLLINGQPVTAAWENNESVEALKQLVKDEPLTIRMSMYGGFEQVGPIGASLPGNDLQVTTEAGDIVLYSGDQMVIFYGSNSWAYTRLGHITDKNAGELTELLGNEDVSVTLSLT